MNQEAIYIQAGGVPVVESFNAADPIWNFGWQAPQWRSDEEHAAVEEAVRAMPRFEIIGNPNDDVEAADLTKFWRHDTVKSALGFEYTGTHQLTGSCVGAGGGNAAFSLLAFEVLQSGDPERIILPFYPYTYGRSRYHSGMRGRGDGSTGAGWAKAATEDGVIDNALEGLPRPTSTSDGIIWGKDVEYDWSVGGSIPEKWITEGRQRKIGTAAVMRDSGDIRRALANGYSVTNASMYGFNAKVQDGVLLAIKGPRWSHQMSIHAFMKHARLGFLYWMQNQWGLNAHGKCPTGMPLGGAWVPEKDIDWICQTGEVYAFSMYNGYPSQKIDWDTI